jgi:hypothetical protein
VLPFKLIAPEVLPIFTVPVAAPPKLILVTAVFSRSNEPAAPIILVVKVGLVPKTATPVPVSSVRAAERAAEVPVDTRFLLPSVKTAWDQSVKLKFRL